MQRRTVLRLGIAAGATVALGAALIATVSRGRQDGRLTAPAREMFAAIARGVLGPLVPVDATAAQVMLQAHLDRLDAAIQGMPPHVQVEIDELATIAASAPGRRWLIGLSTPWAEATAAQVEVALTDLRGSSIALRQQVYQALRELTNAAFFADAGTWALLGYAGQRPVPNSPPA
jgi:hypothetical protein